jgi:hypothetical protein
MSLAKKINTLKFQLDTFVAGRPDLEIKAGDIKEEWDLEEEVKKVVSDTKRAELYRIIHATRAFDTGLWVFLEKFYCRSSSSHSITDYVGDLQRNVTAATGFNQLSGTIATKIKDEVAKKRNLYCHVSGKFPTKEEANFVVSKILEYYSLVLGLVK